MAKREAPQRPDWLVDGAPVVVASSGSGGPDRVESTTVKKVSDHSFTVVGSNLRFRVATQDHHSAGAWSRWTRVLHPDSDQAKKILAAHYSHGLIASARAAFDRWSATGGRSREHLASAIAALQAVEADQE
jgi:hypothetical protein